MAANRGSIDFESHRRAAEEEDFAWLLARGVSVEEATRRTGLREGTLQQRQSRAREAGLSERR